MFHMGTVMIVVSYMFFSLKHHAVRQREPMWPCKVPILKLNNQKQVELITDSMPCDQNFLKNFYVKNHPRVSQMFPDEEKLNRNK